MSFDTLDMVVLGVGLIFALTAQLRVDRPFPPACPDIESLTLGVAEIRFAIRTAAGSFLTTLSILGLYGPFSSNSTPQWKKYVVAVILASAVFGIMVGLFWGDCAREIFGRTPYVTVRGGELQIRLQAPDCDPV